ncbi:hypothetical protein [Agrococcus beijingensis]|uniref:hypothetical protein n=1 Tax=Agrococcus beijingensis TaxID=3068634 RepID=UPI002741C317|nr:hypothetical protein [Agrococcus sp. REN33]
MTHTQRRRAPAKAAVAEPARPAAAPSVPAPAADQPALVAAPAAPITFQQLRDAWDEVLQKLADQHRSAWMLLSNTTPIGLGEGDVLMLGFQSDADVQRFREVQGGQPSFADLLRTAIKELLGIEVKYLPRTRQGGARTPAAPPAAPGDDEVHRAASAADPAPTRAHAPARASASASSTPPTPSAAAAKPPVAAKPAAAPVAAEAVTGWAVATIPTDAEAPPEDLPEQGLPDQPEPDPFSFVSAPDAPPAAEPKPEPKPKPVSSGPSLAELALSAPAPEPALSASQVARYGEAVVREELGAELIEERPRVRGER